MKKMIITLLLLAIAMIGNQLQAEIISLENLTVTNLRNVLSEDYGTKIDDDVIVITTASGRAFLKIIPFKKEKLLRIQGFHGKYEKKTIQELIALANKWNETKRFLRVSINPDDGSIICSYYLVCVKGVDSENLLGSLEWFIDLRESWIEFVLNDGITDYEKERREKAFQGLLAEANEGDAKAQYLVGVAYHEEIGVEQDDEKAFYWFMKAAEQGNIDALFWVGIMYYEGKGVKQDYVKAAEWFTRGAKQGCYKSQGMLGIMYRDGEGVAKDSKRAFEWFLKAAEQGERGAQYWVGLMYNDGSGIEKSHEKAKEWLSKAAKQGDEDAAQILKLIQQKERSVTPGSVGKIK